MGDSEFDDVAAHLLEPEESLDSEETGIDLDEGYSPPEHPRELGDWADRRRRCLGSLLGALLPRVTIAETLMIDRMTIRRWLGRRDSRGHRTPAISGAKPE